MSSSVDSDDAERAASALSAADGASVVPSLCIICGPTAAGKSAIAHRLAQAHNLTLVSADSRQLYRGFDIGTAKPTAAERTSINYRGLDVVEPSERWSAVQWARDAEQWVRDVGPEQALVVGGTGLYVKALTAPLHDAPTLDPARRIALDRELQQLSVSELRRWCERLDPPRAALGRTQLLRSIEVALLTGRPLSAWHAAPAPRAPFRARWLVVDPGARLAEQIAHRVDAMIADGWADEVRRLLASVPSDAPAWQACGYAAMRDLVEGRASPAAARDTIIIGTRQYAKRQRTWFRHQLAGAEVTSVDPHDPRAHDIVEHWWQGGSDL